MTLIISEQLFIIIYYLFRDQNDLKRNSIYANILILLSKSSNRSSLDFRLLFYITILLKASRQPRSLSRTIKS